MPVRRWPLFAVFAVALCAGRAMPWTRWLLACLGVFTVVAYSLEGNWWVVAVSVPVFAGGFGASFVVERGSRALDREMRALRDGARAAESGGAS